MGLHEQGRRKPSTADPQKAMGSGVRRGLLSGHESIAQVRVGEQDTPGQGTMRSQGHPRSRTAAAHGPEKEKWEMPLSYPPTGETGGEQSHAAEVFMGG